MRNNEKRLGANNDSTPANEIAPGLSFVVPTEFVELPSQGKFYPPNHPLFNQTVIEIKQMTAKEEDILTSESLIRNGVVLHRFIESVIVDDKIDPLSILTCDRNAIIVWSRIYGYGAEYLTKFQCPSCQKVEEISFDLDAILKEQSQKETNLEGLRFSDNNNLMISLPSTGWEIECRMLNGHTEKEVAALQKANLNKDSVATSSIRMIIRSIGGHTDRDIINRAVDVMPARDAVFLRSEYNRAYPELQLLYNYFCKSCNFSKEVEVPITADFFWIK